MKFSAKFKEFYLLLWTFLLYNDTDVYLAPAESLYMYNANDCTVYADTAYTVAYALMQYIAYCDTVYMLLVTILTSW